MPSMWSSICDLDDSRTTFGVKVRLVRSYGNPSFTNKEEIVSWECILHDFQGDRIEATIPKNLIATFKDQLVEGLVYGIKNFKVVHNTKKNKLTTHKYKIILCEDTKIHELFVQNFPMKRFSFKSFEEVQVKDNLYNGSLFDIIGVLVHPGEVQIRTSSTGEQKKLIELTLEDTERRRLYCTLWENYVDDFLKLFEKENQDTNILIVQFCKTSIYRGEIRACNAFNVTNLLLNADVPEINDFRERLVKESSLNTTNNSSISQGAKCTLSNDDLFEGMSNLKTIEDILFDDESGCSWIIGTIDRIDWDYGWSYLSCKRCMKKMIKDERQFYCKHCSAHYESATLRYKIKVHVKDDTGRAQFLL
ncbi:uncharacterized protein LOC130989781 [Salvia miltiorrhiza]|uniref:uncharacterized protein LOC130989781 n=1 Tax=Salvia miltiorrhiza TaxID=226208 RepID=UPI0025AD4A1E|nr:uncharacterized protein LOC130989781 [Salvia miltiorrhiza]